jgi:hypothetical protein
VADHWSWRHRREERRYEIHIDTFIEGFLREMGLLLDRQREGGGMPLCLPHSDSHVLLSFHSTCLRDASVRVSVGGCFEIIYCWGEQFSPQTSLILPDGISK